MIVAKDLEGGVKMGEVFRQGSAIDEDIIKKYDDEFSQVRAEGGVHRSLERGRGVAEPKRHDEELVVAMVCAEGRFADVGVRH